ncbi:hypothetical protein Daus18300_012732 [Diaporthe australafricana]|uniref:Cell wall protein n=1 Tax=Diaporthe australafricana TaxID=127596 RepID=A0ABR3W1U4_9PEZI
MLSNSKSAMVALLLAYRALAVPMSVDEQGHVHQVIDALKTQIGNMGQSPQVITDIESALKNKGVLSDETIAALDQKIVVLTAAQGFKPDEIAALAIKNLKQNGVFDAADKKDGEEKALYLTTEMINKVLAQGGVATMKYCFPMWPFCDICKGH